LHGGLLLRSQEGLNYNYYRDYDPAVGRYVQSDPIELRGGLNTYAYARANPLSRIDPLGLADATDTPWWDRPADAGH
jgi:RHS repeat-associated protein